MSEFDLHVSAEELAEWERDREAANARYAAEEARRRNRPARESREAVEARMGHVLAANQVLREECEQRAEAQACLAEALLDGLLRYRADVVRQLAALRGSNLGLLPSTTNRSEAA
jgi:hypothetical protein